MRKAGRLKLPVASLGAVTLSFVLSAPLLRAAPRRPDASAIIKRSVVVNNSDWRAFPNYSHHERDIIAKLDSSGKRRSEEHKTYRVLMIDGSPYQELIATNGKPLTGQAAAAEKAKLKQEIDKRAHESDSARAARIQKFKKERAEEHLLMNQMADAFNFKLAPDETVNGHECYVLDATPKPDYQPPVTKARVLLGMKGRLWIDKDSYHWVRVHAQVVKPVEFGLFVAKVRPGTEFELEQAPIDGNIWLPIHFTESVNAKVLGVYGIRNSDEEFYSDYERASANAYARTGSTVKHE
jgi:hypothetical protein